MKARKDNKAYQILPQDKEMYLKQGFDVYDDEGVIVEYSPLKKVTYQKHLEALKELEAKLASEHSVELAKAIEGNTLVLPDNTMDLLKTYAESKGIDVGSATTAKGVLEKIIEAEKE